MRKGFRSSLEPPSHRRVNLDGRRPVFCLVSSALVIVLVLVIFGLSGWNVYSHQFAPTSRSFHAGDQVSLLTATDDLSPVFCDGYQVTLMEDDKAYLLPHRARINQSQTATSSLSFRHVPDRRYSFLQVYLLEGSGLDLDACRENGSRTDDIHLLVIKGGDNFHTWKFDPTCSGCLLRHASVNPTTICGSGSGGSGDGSGNGSGSTPRHLPHPPYLSVDVTETDLYVLVVHYQHYQYHQYQHDTLTTHTKMSPPSILRTRHHTNDTPTTTTTHTTTTTTTTTPGVIVTGSFNRTRYDTQDYEKQCQARGERSRTCRFDLRWGSTQDIVVEFLNRTSTSTSNSNSTDAARRLLTGGFGFDSQSQEAQSQSQSLSLSQSERRRPFLTTCRLRYSFWLSVFAGVPVAIGIVVAAIFAWFLCRRSRQPSMKRLSEAAEKRMKADGVVTVTDTTTDRDDAGLVTHAHGVGVVRVSQSEGEGCMGIQIDDD